MRKITKRAQIIAVGISLYFVLLALSYAAATPFFEAPDEEAHFLYIHNLLQTGTLPTLSEGREAIFASGATQGHHPPLYYMAGTALIFWTARDDLAAYRHINPLAAIGTVKPNNQHNYLHNWQPPPGDSADAIWMMRVFSISLSVGTLWLIYRMGGAVFDRPEIGLFAMLLTASVPMFVFISASINNDNMVTFFYTAGVYWCIQTWKKAAITRADMLLLCLILPGVALSKVNGLSLFGVVYTALLVGAGRGLYTWRRAALALGLSLLATALLAGWWYFRNFDLYGDPLAQGVMRGIWGRGAVPDTLQAALSEAWGVWLSVWMVLGKFNVRGPDWFYPYVTGLTLLALPGVLWLWRRYMHQRRVFLLLAGVILLLIASLIVTTLQINVSQGRILYPALGAFTVLLAGGLSALLRRWALLALLPMIVVALLTPVAVLPRTYHPLEVVSIPPAHMQVINAQAESLTLKGYVLHQASAAPGETMRMDVYFTGRHEDDLRLFVKALDPITKQALGGADFYPGMTFTSQLAANTTYRAQVAFVLDSVPPNSPPRQLELAFGWVQPGNERGLTWVNPAGGEIGTTLLSRGPTFIDDTYRAPAPQQTVNIRYGRHIGLVGYSLSSTQAMPGDAITVTLLWRYLQAMPQDWTVTLRLQNPNGEIIAQHDGMPPGYPTSAWLPAPDFPDERILHIPADAPPGAYHLYLGWYNSETGLRLGAEGAVGDRITHDLYQMPPLVEVPHAP